MSFGLNVFELDVPPSNAQPSILRPPNREKGKLNCWTLAIIVIGILVVAVLFSLIYYSTAVVSSKTFSYAPSPDSNGAYKSLTISDVDGQVTVLPWSQSTILINGTLTANGLGSSLSTIKITNSSVDGNVVFKAMFPANTGILFSQTNTATVHVYVPSNIRLSSIQVSNVNGKVQLNNINATNLGVTTVNGNVTANCVYCMNAALTSTNGNVTGTFSVIVSQGLYNLTATNANVSFTAPSSSSYKLKATWLNGYIVCSICTSTPQGKSLTQIFGTGSANVTLDSVNGQITVQAT